jgi:hypothetical protein
MFSWNASFSKVDPEWEILNLSSLALGEAGMNGGAQVDAITKTYDDLAKVCLAAFELRDTLLGRISPGRLTEVQSLPEWTREDWGKHVTDPASPELGAEMDNIAKEDEKKEWYLSSVIATYWLEALATNCCARFHLDANRTTGLSKIQLARQRELEPVGRQRRIAGMIIAAAGFIAAQVPVETSRPLASATTPTASTASG